MRWVRLLGTASLGTAAGFALGWTTRSAPHAADRRPPSVEQALRALDAADRRNDVSGLAAALAAAGPPDRLPEPWRQELELVRLVAGGRPDPLWSFATGGPPSPARARALLYLAQHAAGDDDRRRARDLLRERHPTSWAVAEPASGIPR